MSCSTSCHLIPLASFLYPLILLQVLSSHRTILLPLILYHFLIAQLFPAALRYISLPFSTVLLSLSLTYYLFSYCQHILLPFIFYYFLSSHTTTGYPNFSIFLLYSFLFLSYYLSSYSTPQFLICYFLSSYTFSWKRHIFTISIPRGEAFVTLSCFYAGGAWVPEEERVVMVT